MTAGSVKRAASQNGVTPTRVGSKCQSWEERRLAVTPVERLDPYAVQRHAAHDGLVERAESSGRSVRIRALAQQERHHLDEAGVRRKHSGADAPGIGIIHISTGLDQQLG